MVFTPLSTVFQLYHGDSSHYSCLSWVSPVLGWDSEVSCSRAFPRGSNEDPMRLSPWGPGFFFFFKLYRIGPLPFSMAFRKRRLKSETNGCFPRNS